MTNDKAMQVITKKDNYAEYSDNEIITMVQAGDIYAQDYIINKYKNLVRIKTRAYFLIGADNEDIVQEGMIGLFKAMRDFKDDKDMSFSSFADLCISRQIITAIKTATRQKHIPLNSYISLNRPQDTIENNNGSNATFSDYLLEDRSASPLDIIIGQEDKSYIESHIAKELSGFETTVLYYYLQGISYVEIAKRTGKKEKSIDNALQRVRKKIEKIVVDKDMKIRLR